LKEHIRWTGECLEILDQTQLPTETIYMKLSTPEETAEAIYNLRIRGAPAIGIAAAYGVFLGIKNLASPTASELELELNRASELLLRTRPTARNLSWALERMKMCFRNHAEEDVLIIKNVLENEAIRIHEEDRDCCQRIGEFGAHLIKDGDTILTHCNAGSLATGGIGTALGVIYTAHDQGKRVRVIVTETRPLLQGARLTTYELKEAGIEVTLICDTMVGRVMRKGWVDLCLVGADRIAANGDTVNKIGTYQVALLAQYHHIPFYVAAPLSSLDLSLEDGSSIPIEERPEEEIVSGLGRRIAPQDIKIYNPSFDITPAELISAIITEKGIIVPPYSLRSSLTSGGN